jgi:hypothetical protein
MGKTRILSLDGGGSHMSIPARALGALFGDDTPGDQIVASFDFVVANSGGAIVLAALCCGYTPRQIANQYLDASTIRKMFCPRWTAAVPLLRSVLPRYSTEGKARALAGMMDARWSSGPRPSTILLTDWPRILGASVQLLIPAFDFDQRRVSFFRSNPASPAKSSQPAVNATLLEAVHASSTPPVPYFDRPAAVRGHRYWDGGLGGYDNPVLAGVVEALAQQPGAVDAVRVLSLGASTRARPTASASVRPPIGEPRRSECPVDAVRVAAGVIFDDPPDAASFHAYVALAQPLPLPGQHSDGGNFVRMSPFIHPNWTGSGWALPRGLSPGEFGTLCSLALDTMKQADIDIIGKMTGLWMDSAAEGLHNQPIRSGIHYACDIGQDTFAEAVARWRAIS